MTETVEVQKNLVPEPVQEEPKGEKIYLTWKSPSRPFKKRKKPWFVRVGILVLGFSLFLIFFKQFLLVAIIFVLTIVAFLLASVEPEILEHAITSQGIDTAGKSYIYKELKVFYFTQKHGQDILNIELGGRIPGILWLLLEDQDRYKVRDILKQHLPFREIAPISVADQFFEYVAKKLSLD